MGYRCSFDLSGVVVSVEVVRPDGMAALRWAALAQMELQRACAEAGMLVFPLLRCDGVLLSSVQVVDCSHCGHSILVVNGAWTGAEFKKSWRYSGAGGFLNIVNSARAWGLAVGVRDAQMELDL